ncbi:MAG: small basic protein [Phycisphaerae bacterium]
MSLDKSLRSHGALERHRNVLTRAERVDVLREDEEWEEGDEVFGLPKVAHRKVSTKRHKPEKAEAAEGEGLEGEAAPAEGEVPEGAEGTREGTA